MPKGTLSNFHFLSALSLTPIISFFHSFIHFLPVAFPMLFLLLSVFFLFALRSFCNEILFFSQHIHIDPSIFSYLGFVFTSFSFFLLFACCFLNRCYLQNFLIYTLVRSLVAFINNAKEISSCLEIHKQQPRK